MKKQERNKDIDGYRKPDKPLHVKPKRVQDLIDIMEIEESGLFKLRQNRFSRSYCFSDVNFAKMDDDEQLDVMASLAKLYNAIGKPFKITINKKKYDKEMLEENFVFASEYEDEFRDTKGVFNEEIRRAISSGNRKRICQEKYLTITIDRNSFAEADAAFLIIENNIGKQLQLLNSRLTKLDSAKRIKVLHDAMHLNKEELLPKVDFSDYQSEFADFRDDIIPNVFIDDDKKNTIIIRNQGKEQYIRSFYCKKFPKNVSDSFIQELATAQFYGYVTIDVSPVMISTALADANRAEMNIQNKIDNQQQARRSRNNYDLEPSRILKREKEEIQEILDAYDDNDEQCFWFSVTVVAFAESMEELNQHQETIEAIARNADVIVDTCDYRQREAFFSALPIGVRLNDYMKTIQTNNLAVLMPFYTQEIQETDGRFWGVNEVSRVPVMGNNRLQEDPHMWIIGKTGAGKTMWEARDLFQSFFRYPKDQFIIIDPKSDYENWIPLLGGSVINFNENVTINPLDCKNAKFMDAAEIQQFLERKTMLMMALVQQRYKNTILSPVHESLISKAVTEIYKDLFSGKTDTPPELKDFYLWLCDNGDHFEEAKHMASAIEMIALGAIRGFAGQSTVVLDNRLTCFSFREMKETLRPLAMTFLIDFLDEQVMRNFKEGIVTDIRIDESNELWKDPYTAKFFNEKWRLYRSLGGIFTALIQNAARIEDNPIISECFANSSCYVILKQKPVDAAACGRLLGLAPSQAGYLKDTITGHGLIIMGNDQVRFDSELPKESRLYQLFNTNFHEKNRTT